MKPKKGERYLYRDSNCQLYHVVVLKPGRWFSMCYWGLKDLDYGTRTERVGRKPNWRLMEDVEL